MSISGYLCRTAFGFALLVSGVSAVGTARVASGQALPTFTGVIQVPVGNHGWTSVELVDSVQLKTSDGYDAWRETVALNLETGAVESTIDDSWLVRRQTYLPLSRGGAFFPYRHMLARMAGDLQWIIQNVHLLPEAERAQRTLEVQGAARYVAGLMNQLDRQAPETLSLAQNPGIISPGAPLTVEVDTVAAEARELVVEIFDQDWNYLGGTRAPVEPGRGSVSVVLELPSRLPRDEPGMIAVKLLPVGGQWTEKLAEQTRPVFYRAP